MSIKLLVLITILAAILRFYHISSNPPGLYADEISFGYNAYSLLKTARDEYGIFLPAAIRSFDDYKTPLYAYLLIPSILIFNLTEIAVRLPSAIFGTLSVPLIYLISLKIFKRKKISLFGALLLAISPWHLQFSRAGFEANVMVFFEVLGFTLFLYSKNRLKFLLASAISFGLAFNSYHAARIWIPLFFLAIAFFYRKDILGSIYKITLSLLIFALFIIPTVLNFKQALIRGKEVSIFGKENAPKEFVQNYLAHFSPTFLFFSGDSIGRHSVSGMGELYVFQIPFVIIGIVALLKKTDRNYKLLLTWLILSPIPASIATPVPHALRSITSIPLWSIITAVGAVSFLNSKIEKHFKYAAILLVGLIFAYNVFTYLHLYHIHYPKEKAADWSAGTKDMVLYVNDIKKSSENIYVTKDNGIPYIYFLFYTKYDPKTYQQEHGDNNHFDNYTFYKGVWNFADTGEYLVVADPGSHPGNLMKEIFINEDDLLYRIGKK